MSIHNRNRLPSSGRAIPFLLLLGTLAFNLSSPPGHRAEIGSRTLASLQEVDPSDLGKTPCGDSAFKDADKYPNGVECNISQLIDNKKVKAKVNVKVVKDSDNVKNGNSEHLEVVISDMNTACSTCSGGVLHAEKKNIAFTGSTDDLKDISQQILNKFTPEAVAFIQGQENAERGVTTNSETQTSEHSVSHDRCETDLSGNRYNAEQQMNCRINKLDSMNDKKARDYFHKNIENEIRIGLTSTDAYKRKVALDAVARLRGSAKFENLVKESLGEGLEQKEKLLALELQALPANDPRRFALMQEILKLNQSKAALGITNTDSTERLLTSLLNPQTGNGTEQAMLQLLTQLLGRQNGAFGQQQGLLGLPNNFANGLNGFQNFNPATGLMNNNIFNAGRPGIYNAGNSAIYNARYQQLMANINSGSLQQQQRPAFWMGGPQTSMLAPQYTGGIVGSQSAYPAIGSVNYGGAPAYASIPSSSYAWGSGISLISPPTFGAWPSSASYSVAGGIGLGGGIGAGGYRPAPAYAPLAP